MKFILQALSFTGVALVALVGADQLAQYGTPVLGTALAGGSGMLTGLTVMALALGDWR